MHKKLTLQDLLNKKESITNGREETRELYVNSLDGTILIKKPDRKLCLEAIDMDDTDYADIFVVYNCVVEPNLKDQKLHQAYGVIEPDDIVQAIFEPGEITNISKECLKYAGYINSVEVVADIKNS
ncbi:phage tail assembly chaperone [Vallitalea okinawensis]|uniref:phage tail assembly chaperone n=1 Tax=Vallitalea okinawensis TaxID=2078660 RepID=UPI000CFD619A|nr:hypothetical protein [Vallitalea okinawensis]